MLDMHDPRHAHIDHRLRNDLIIWLGTVRPDGRPHLVPVWFLWDGASVLILSEPDTQKVRNLRHDARVTLALDDTHHGADVIVIEGTAELVADPASAVTPPAYATKYAANMARMSLDAHSMVARYSQAIRISPVRFVGE